MARHHRVGLLLAVASLLSGGCTARAGARPQEPDSVSQPAVSQAAERDTSQSQTSQSQTSRSQTTQTQAPTPLPPVYDAQPAIDAVLDAPPLHRTHWGVHVLDAATGAIVYSRDAESHFIPASNMKLAATAAALGRLGPEYRYRTQLLATGRDGEAAAALVVVGSGDPTWSERFHDTAEAPLDSLAARVRARGITSVQELVVDASRFVDAPVPAVWEVGDLPWSYAPPVAAFAAAEATFGLVMQGGRMAGSAGTARVIGPLPQPIAGAVVTDTAGARATLHVDYLARFDTVRFVGRVAPSASDTSILAVTRPIEGTAAAFASALSRAGVRVGTVRILRDTLEARRLRDAAVLLDTWESPPLREIVAAILQPSQNWIADQLHWTLGAELAGDGSWNGGSEAVASFLYDVVRLDSGTVRIRDSSGLSAQNLLTPAAVVAVLAHARGQTWGPAYREALAAPGLAESTLENRLEPLRDRLAAKTGTISNVAALSGYLVTDDGRELIFSIIANGSGLPSATTGAAIDRVVSILARTTPPEGRE